MTSDTSMNDTFDQLKTGPVPSEQTPSLDNPQTQIPVYGGGIKEKKKINPKILGGAILILALLVGGGALAFRSSGALLSTNQDTRSRAACLRCGGGSCPDGWSYPGDDCAPQATCGQRATEACSGHQGAPQQQQQATQAPANNTQNTTSSCNCGGTPCGQTRCRNNGEFMDVCQNGNWTAASSNTCPRPAPVVTAVVTQAPANAGTGGSTSSTSDDCSGKNCGSGTCFTGPNAHDGGWGCTCSNGMTLGPSTNPGVCPATTGATSSTTCTSGQVRCRSGQYNDICINGAWTAGGNACTPLTGGGSPAAGCTGGVSCPISYCNDGQDVPADGCYKGGSCLSRTAAACVGHNGSQGGAGGVAISTTTTGTSTTGTYTAGSKTGTGTMGDACTTTADCGKSGTVQMGCNYCGAAIGYKCTMGGSTNAVEVGCSQPGMNTITYPTACGGLGGFQIRCHNDGTYVGDICYYDTVKKTWAITTVIADACGATCENGGIQQSSNANRCSGPAGPNSIVSASGFVGCGNAVTGGNGDACSNCYRVSGKLTCTREGTSCGAKVECRATATAAAPMATSNPTNAAAQVTRTQTNILVTDVAGQCVMVKLWIKDENNEWVNIPFNQAAGKIKTGDTVRLSTSGSGRIFTQARFRIKVNDGAFGSWLTTSTKDKGEYYINYAIPSLSLFVVESQVF